MHWSSRKAIISTGVVLLFGLLQIQIQNVTPAVLAIASRTTCDKDGRHQHCSTGAGHDDPPHQKEDEQKIPQEGRKKDHEETGTPRDDSSIDGEAKISEWLNMSRRQSKQSGITGWIWHIVEQVIKHVQDIGLVKLVFTAVIPYLMKTIYHKYKLRQARHRDPFYGIFVEELGADPETYSDIESPNSRAKQLYDFLQTDILSNFSWREGGTNTGENSEAMDKYPTLKDVVLRGELSVEIMTVLAKTLSKSILDVSSVKTTPSRWFWNQLPTVSTLHSRRAEIISTWMTTLKEDGHEDLLASLLPSAAADSNGDQPNSSMAITQENITTTVNFVNSAVQGNVVVNVPDNSVYAKARLEHGMYHPPPSNSHMVRRQDTWREMTARFGRTEDKRTVIRLCGMGGVGKSQIAVDYFLNAPFEYALKAWFDCRSKQRLQEQYVELYEGYRVTYPEENVDPLDRNDTLDRHVEVVRTWLSGLPYDVLLVYDDIDVDKDAVTMKELENLFFPCESCCFHGLVTTRDRMDLPSSCNEKLEVHKMGRSESVKLLENVIGSSSGDELNRLAGTLDDLPLALKQAASYMHVTGYDVNQFLKKFQKRTKNLLEGGASSVSEKVLDGQESIWTTFTLSLERIIGVDDSPRVVKIFEHFSWLGTDWIPNDYLISVVADYLNEDEETAEDVWNEEVKPILWRYGLINVHQDSFGSSVSVHAILQTILQERSREQGGQWTLSCWRRCHRVLNSKVENHLERGSLGYKSLWAHAEALYKHAKEMAKLSDDDEMEYQPTCLGTIFIELGYYDSALCYYSHKYDIENRCLPPNDVNIANTMEMLGIIYRNLGDYERAKSLYGDALRIKEAHYPSGHIEIGKTKENLGIVHRNLGECELPKSLCEDALSIKEAHYPTDHVEVGKTKENLARVFRNLGDYEHAQSLYEDALCIKEGHYPSQHVELGKTKESLGNLYRIRGEYERAKALCEDALRINQAHYPLDHVNIGVAKGNLAIVYRNLGDYERAKALYEDGLRIKEAHYPPDHAEIGKTKQNVAKVYINLGDYERAKSLYEDALRIIEARYPAGHVNIGVIKQNLGMVYENLGNYERAKSLYEDALQIKETRYGSDHVNIGAAKVNLGSVHRNLGDYERAKSLFEESLSIFQDHYPSDHVNIGHAKNHCGMVYQNLGDYEGAELLYNDALRIKQAHYGEDHLEMAVLQRNLGTLYKSLGSLCSAEKHLDKALRIQQANYPLNHIEIGETKQELGDVYRCKGEYERSESFLREALKIKQQFYSPKHVKVGEALEMLGHLLSNVSEVGDAKQCYKDALQIKEAYYTQSHAEIVKTKKSLESLVGMHNSS